MLNDILKKNELENPKDKESDFESLCLIALNSRVQSPREHNWQVKNNVFNDLYKHEMDN